jgi:hypothetical protein
VVRVTAQGLIRFDDTKTESETRTLAHETEIYREDSIVGNIPLALIF